jgi:polar amino acid transport system substrate-binding protein
MPMRMRELLTVAALTLAAVPVSQAAPTSLPVGVYPNYPPLDMKDPATGELKGFDVALGNAIAAKLGVSLDWQETAFVQLLPSVQTGRIRVFFNGMDDTAPRRELIAFVDYLKSGTQFMVAATKAADYPDATALCGKKVAASRGTNIPSQLAEWSKANCEAKGRRAIQYFGADNNIDARSQLKQGRVDAMAQDSLTIPYVREQEPNTYVTVGEPFDYQLMGIGVGKTDQALQHQMQTALQALIDDGTYALLLKEWHLPPTSGVDKVTINAEE